MKLAIEKRHNEISGVVKQKSFTIQHGSHIMKILSGMYSDPIEACVREYLSNAGDAYTKMLADDPSATIIPPIITAPGPLSPVFSIRDFGVGMDYETVWNTFTSYGSTTKSNNNVEQGGFGIGCKTAFCYNNGSSWTVESRYNGRLYIFSAQLDENSVPQFSELLETTTDEPNGVTINIPVLRSDVEAFCNALRKHLPTFQYDYELEGMSKPAKTTYILKTSRFGIRADKYSNQPPNIRAIIGGVAYPVNVEFIGYKEWFHTIKFMGVNNYRYPTVLSYLDIFMNVGECDIVPSRDGLQYTERTIHALRDTFTNYFDKEISKYIKDKIKSYGDNYYDIFSFVHSLFRYVTLPEVITINNVKIGSNTLKYQNIVSMLPVNSEVIRTDVTRQHSTHGRYTGINDTIPTDLIFNGFDSVSKILLDDTTLKPNKVIRLCKAFHKKHACGTTPSGKISTSVLHSDPMYIVLNSGLNPQQLSAILGNVDLSKIILVSSFANTMTPLREETENTKYYILSSRKNWLPRVRSPKNAVKYYVSKDVDVNRTVPDYIHWTIYYYFSVNKINNSDRKIYHIPKNDIDEFDDSWVCLDDKVLDYCKTIITDPKHLQFIQKYYRHDLINQHTTANNLNPPLNIYGTIEYSKFYECVNILLKNNIKLPSDVTDSIRDFKNIQSDIKSYESYKSILVTCIRYVYHYDAPFIADIFNTITRVPDNLITKYIDKYPILKIIMHQVKFNYYPNDAIREFIALSGKDFIHHALTFEP